MKEVNPNERCIFRRFECPKCEGVFYEWEFELEKEQLGNYYDLVEIKCKVCGYITRSRVYENKSV